MRSPIEILKKLPLRRLRTRATALASCRNVAPGIYVCDHGTSSLIIALYMLSEYHRSLEEYDGRELVQEIRKFVEFLSLPECYTVFLTMTKPIDSRSYVKKLDHKLQMKLVELQVDRANTRLQSEVLEMMKIKKRVLQGIIPLSINSVTAIVCTTNTMEGIELYVKTLKELKRVVESIIDIVLKPFNSETLVNLLANFCFGKQTS